MWSLYLAIGAGSIPVSFLINDDEPIDSSRVPPCVLRSLARQSKGSHAWERPIQPPPYNRQPMAALARGLGAACRISVARLRPAESDARGRPSTWSKTFGAVRQVRGGASLLLVVDSKDRRPICYTRTKIYSI